MAATVGLAALYLNGGFDISLPGAAAAVTGSPTVPATLTPQPTFTPLPTATETQAPTPSPLPPIEYKVVQNDTCLKIAAIYNVSYQSIIQLNQLDPNCTLSVGQSLMIPQPTPTPTTLPTATLPAGVSTQPPRATYTVHAGDTLQAIASFYGIAVKDLMEVNQITDPSSIRAGQILIIPIERIVTPGPTPTATPPPPWPAPNQLLPADGQTFSTTDATVTVQWTSVGTLRPDEYYYVVVEDVTCNCARLYKQAVSETKLIVPTTFRPEDEAIHIYRWSVTTVREKPSAGGQPEYDSAGAASANRVFAWQGGVTTAP